MNTTPSRAEPPDKEASPSPEKMQDIVIEDADKSAIEENLSDIWTTDSLEQLRLCRNRAYHKFSLKRRQHLNVSLGSLVQKEWLTYFPDSKLTGKALLEAYNKNFEVKDSLGPSQKKKLKVDKSIPPQESDVTASTSEHKDDHSDKQWSDQMLTNLLACGETATERLNAGEKSDFSTVLFEEWKKIYPCSTLTARNLKSRYTVYQKTKAELPPAAKKRKLEQVLYQTNNHITRPQHVVQVVPEHNGADGARLKLSKEENKVCPKHVIHLFNDKDENVECFLTEQLLAIRTQLESHFPGCDVYKPKKPKGFAPAVLQEWKKLYPNSEESTKTICFKLARYDRAPEDDNFGIRVTPKGREMWSQVMLKHLAEARKLAVEQAYRMGAPQELLTLWRENWEKMYPNYSGDWKATMNRYKYHFGSIDSLNPEYEDPENLSEVGIKTAVAVADKYPFDLVKGFRKWTAAMVADLLETKSKIKRSRPDLEIGSSEFNRLLLSEFQQLYPKCIESSRSIFSKLQSVEKDDHFKMIRDRICDQDSVEINTEPLDEIIEVPSKKFKKDSFVPETRPYKRKKSGQAVPVRPQILRKFPVKYQQSESNDEILAPESIKKEAGEDEQISIEGFEGWTIFMIKDFVSCMDATRKKFATLKEKAPEGTQIKLVPLLLEEWKLMYPDTTETVKTFQTRIKHLSQQKEIIKKHLGLLRAKSAESEELKNLPVKHEEPFRWNKTMINDVIDSRKRALVAKESQSGSGRKVSFHTLWENEFKKIYPNSTFTSNNLSVHFWTWRKHQQKASQKRGKKATFESEQVQTSPLSEQVVNGHVWNRSEKLRLFEVGQKTEAMLRDSGTPNEVKVQGFANILFHQWKKANSDRELDPKTETSRSLNFIYSKLSREGISPDQEDENGISGLTPSAKRFLIEVGEKIERHLSATNAWKSFGHLLQAEWKKQDRHKLGNESVKYLSGLYLRLKRQEENDASKFITATWTPKHNRVLRECMEELSHLAVTEGLIAYKESVIRSWRKKFTKSSISDELLWNKVKDLSVMEDSHLTDVVVRRNQPAVRKESAEPPFVKDELEEAPMSWNKTEIWTLFQAYSAAKIELKTFPSDGSRPQLASLVHSNFVNFYPNCNMSPSHLMSKLFLLKTDHVKGAIQVPQPSKIPVPCGEAKVFSDEKRPKTLVFRTWTQEMIDDMLSTRKIAISKKKKQMQQHSSSQSKTMTDIWFEEFIKIHPEYKSTKKNLWRKYKWYKSRMEDSTSQNVESNSQGESSDNKLQLDFDAWQMKPIRKDVFHYVKCVLEESRIFLPTKIVDAEPVVTPPPLQTFVRPALLPVVSAAVVAPPPAMIQPLVSVQTAVPSQIIQPSMQVLTSTQNQLIPSEVSPTVSAPVLPVVQSVVAQGLPASQITIVPVSQVPPGTCKNGSSDTIKLPGGATLVALTDRNVEQLLKPKAVEKPHVTITVGDKQDTAVASVKVEPPDSQSPLLLPQTATITAIMTTPTQQIPITIPYPINVPTFHPRSTLVHPPPLSQLKPGVLAEAPCQISNRVKTRLEELNIELPQFQSFLRIYATCRDDFIATLKKGYLGFFPYFLETAWKENYPESSKNVTGRKLSNLIDLYAEDRRRGKLITPEYLTKAPCNFVVTELLLKQLMDTFMTRKISLESLVEMSLPDPIIYDEMCRHWLKSHPESRMTTKQMISLHQMINFETGKDSSPVVACQLTEIWKMFDKEVSLKSVCEPTNEADSEVEEYDLTPTYDETNLSMDELQEWFLETINIPSVNDSKPRPRLVLKINRNFTWSEESTKEVQVCSNIANRLWLDQKWRHKRRRLPDLLHRVWKRRNPSSTISSRNLFAICAKLVRVAKRNSSAFMKLEMESLLSSCEEYSRNEENVQVIDEVKEGLRRQKEDLKRADKTTAGPGAGFSLTSLSRNANLNIENWDKQDFSKDEDVLAYIEAMQKVSPKGCPVTIWTADVIRDLMAARSKARQRKRVWEEWAVKKYGGVGIAYNMPNVKFTKVDDMFKEEWAKLRPEMGNLSIWTLVSYARKFDNLKKQLMEATGIKEVKHPGSDLDTIEKSVAVVLFPNSCIPKYELEKIEKSSTLCQELKDLIITRQLAKERQLEESGDNFDYTLSYLWSQTWRELHPDSDLTGNELGRRLFCYEQDRVVRAHLGAALIRVTDPESQPHQPVPQPDEVIDVPPRGLVFPENEGQGERFNLTCYQTWQEPRGLIQQNFVHLSRNFLHPNHPALQIPIVKLKPTVVKKHLAPVWELPPKGINSLKEERPEVPLGICFESQLEKFICIECSQTFDNATNYVYHQRLHQLPDPLGKFDFSIFEDEPMDAGKNPEPLCQKL